MSIDARFIALALSSFFTRALYSCLRCSSSSGDDLARGLLAPAPPPSSPSPASSNAAFATAGSNPAVLTRPSPTPTRLCVNLLVTKSLNPTLPSGRVAPPFGGDESREICPRLCPRSPRSTTRTDARRAAADEPTATSGPPPPRACPARPGLGLGLGFAEDTGPDAPASDPLGCSDPPPPSWSSCFGGEYLGDLERIPRAPTCS